MTIDYCPSCGDHVPAHAYFCGGCGGAVSGVGEEDAQSRGLAHDANVAAASGACAACGRVHAAGGPNTIACSLATPSAGPLMPGSASTAAPPSIQQSASPPTPLAPAETGSVSKKPGSTPQPYFEIGLPDGEKRLFKTKREIRDAIVAGEVPRTATIGGTALPGAQQAQSVETWATANDMQSLYRPVWSRTMKGALIGALVVAALKFIDTFVGIAILNPGAALLFVAVVAFLASPKWKPQIGFAGFMIWQQANLPFGAFNTLLGAWFGVCVFAAVFGISSGMAVGTAVGYLRVSRIPKAPDAQPEGSRPAIWGLAVPLTFFVAAVVVYLEVILPAILKSLQ